MIMRSSRAACLSLAVWCGANLPARADEPADVRAWAEAIDQADLFGPGVDASGRTLEWGHLKLTLRSGRLVPLRAGGRVVGAFWSGAGRARYVSREPLEREVFRINVERASSYRVDAEGGVEDELRSALIFVASGAETLAGAAGWPDGETPAESARALAELKKAWKDDTLRSPRQYLAQAVVDASAEPTVVAHLHGERHDAQYLLDGLREGAESFGVMWRGPRFSGPGRALRHLSWQPIGRERLDAPPTPATLVDLDATLVNPRGRTAQVTLRQTFELRAPRRVLAVQLPAQFGDGDGGLVDYRLERVEAADGRALAFAQRDNDLLVDLGRRTAAGERVAVVLTLSGDVLVRPQGDNYWSLFNWYPVAANAAATGFGYRAVVKVAKPFTPFGSGAVVRRWEEGDLACAEFRETAPVQYAALLAGKYTTYTDERPTLKVNVSTYGHAKPDAARTVAALVHAFVAAYEPLLGPLPFRELHVLEINSYGFGIAPAGVIFITKEAFGANPFADPLASLTVKNVNRRLAHEVAHAWWANTVMPREIEDHWMAESLAEYYSALAMMLRDKGELDQALVEWKSDAKARGSLYLASALAGDDAWRERVSLLYSRGPLMLHALRAELGDQHFFTLFKSLVRSFPGKPAGTRDVLALGKLATGKDLRPFFDRYLFGTETPSLKK
jgi:hypothetical protein